MSIWNGLPGEPTEVYTLDGHYAGRVVEAWPEAYAGDADLARTVGKAGKGYFRLAGTDGADLYIPFDALADFTEERIRLTVTRKALGKQGWGQRPATLPTP